MQLTFKWEGHGEYSLGELGSLKHHFGWRATATAEGRSWAIKASRSWKIRATDKESGALGALYRPRAKSGHDESKDGYIELGPRRLEWQCQQGRCRLTEDQHEVAHFEPLPGKGGLRVTLAEDRAPEPLLILFCCWLSRPQADVPIVFPVP